ncbi:MAG: UMP kinase [Candidatus Bathyarchaeia archaeon]
MRIVLRIGGSVVASPINPVLIREYADLLRELKAQKHELAVVVGGGNLARELIAVAKDVGLDEPAQDEIAISISRVFAQLLMKKLGTLGCERVPLTVEDAAECLANGKVAIMGGLKPGMTTDTVAAMVAEKVKADLLLKATDQEGVYNKDPKNHPDAVKLDHLSFEDLARVFSQSKHAAGIHQIIDPEAVKILKRHHVRVVVVNGFKIGNVLMVIKGKHVGTLID